MKNTINILLFVLHSSTASMSEVVTPGCDATSTLYQSGNCCDDKSNRTFCDSVRNLYQQVACCSYVEPDSTKQEVIFEYNDFINNDTAWDEFLMAADTSFRFYQIYVTKSSGIYFPPDPSEPENANLINNSFFNRYVDCVLEDLIPVIKPMYSDPTNISKLGTPMFLFTSTVGRVLANKTCIDPSTIVGLAYGADPNLVTTMLGQNFTDTQELVNFVANFSRDVLDVIVESESGIRQEVVKGMAESFVPPCYNVEWRNNKTVAVVFPNHECAQLSATVSTFDMLFFAAYAHNGLNVKYSFDFSITMELVNYFLDISVNFALNTWGYSGQNSVKHVVPVNSSIDTTSIVEAIQTNLFHDEELIMHLGHLLLNANLMHGENWEGNPFGQYNHLASCVKTSDGFGIAVLGQDFTTPHNQLRPHVISHVWIFEDDKKPFEVKQWDGNSSKALWETTNMTAGNTYRYLAWCTQHGAHTGFITCEEPDTANI